MPYYNRDDFIRACSTSMFSVRILKRALEDAGQLFGLYETSQVLAFIRSGGCQDLKFINTKPWENNPDKTQPIQVDGYEFITNKKRGYLAFLYNDKTKKWIIKSFHLAHSEGESDMLYRPFYNLLGGTK